MVMRKGFRIVVQNGISGVGLPGEVPALCDFPIQMFTPGSDLTPLKENIDKIVQGLTQWQPKLTKTGVFSPPKITVEGEDYAQALAKMNLLFLKNQWGDGQPLLPATDERVNWILTGTDLGPDMVSAKLCPEVESRRLGRLRWHSPWLEDGLSISLC
jgi:hypothetical protein